MKTAFLRACFAFCILHLAFGIAAVAQEAQPQAAFPRGAKPSPRHKILAVPQHKPLADVPAQVARIPAQNGMFGNDQYGCCVTAEEAFSKDCDGVLLSTQVVVDWARQHGFLNGADLVSVMEAMAKDGFPGTSGEVYNDGSYSSVAYGDETTLHSAIAQGNVKIAIDANALPSTASNQQNGWYVTGEGNWPNTDHCISICGYGPAEYLFSQLQLPTPAALAGTSGYVVDTWNSIGFVDHAWLMSAMAGAGEAYVRNPTTVVVPTPAPPSPSPRHRLSFAEFFQLLLARLHPHLTPGQAKAIADFFADDNSARVNLLERIVYRRLVRAGLICEDEAIGSINWQELIAIAKELEPIIIPLIPVLFGDDHASVSAPAFSLCAGQTKYRKECGPYGCKLVPIQPADAPRAQTVPAPHRGASRPSFRTRRPFLRRSE